MNVNYRSCYYPWVSLLSLLFKVLVKAYNWRYRLPAHIYPIYIKVRDAAWQRLFSDLSTRKATTGFEPVIRVLQTRALPLGYVATDSLWLIANDLIQCDIAYSHYSDFPERAMGFEPTTFSLARRHSTTELRPHDKFFHFVK